MYTVDSIGVIASQLLEHSASWKVLHVYRSCFYCVNECGDILCIGSRQIGRGPFTITVNQLMSGLESKVSKSEQLVLENNYLRFHNAKDSIIINRYKRWDKTFRASRAFPSSIQGHNELICNLAQNAAPLNSLGTLIPAILSKTASFNSNQNDLAQLIQAKTLRVITRCRELPVFSDAGQFSQAFSEHLSGLIGVGFGLTPSGDDFCCGAVLGLAHMQYSRLAEKVAVLLSKKAEEKTTIISQAFFRSLAQTYISENQARLLERFGHTAPSDLKQILISIASHGSTSGWDMLAGFAFGIDQGCRLSSDTCLENKMVCQC